MTRPVHAFVLGAALTLFGQTGIASSLEQAGQPEQSVSVMKTYGVGVATSKGLRTVVPAGWRTFVQPDVALPETMSWKIGDEWTQVLAELGKSANASVLVDWQLKTVHVRSAESALDEGAKRAEMLQAATTPLPRFDAKTHAPQKPLVARTEGELGVGQASPATSNPAKFIVSTTPVAPKLAAGLTDERTLPKASDAKPIPGDAEPVKQALDARVPPVGAAAAESQSKALESAGTAAPSGPAPAPVIAVAEAAEPPAKLTAPAAVPAEAPKPELAPAPPAAEKPALTLAPLNDMAVMAKAPEVAAPASAATPPDTKQAETAELIARLHAERAREAELQAKLSLVEAPAIKPTPEVQPPTPAWPAPAAPAVVTSPSTATVAVKVAAPTPTPAPAIAPVNLAAASQLASALSAAPTVALTPNVVRPGDTADFVYTQPVALNKPSARTVAQSIANRFHLRLVWAAPEVQLRGPVTLLGNSAEEDMTLLAKALGTFSPVSIAIPTGQGVLRAQAKEGTYPDLVVNRVLTSTPTVVATALDSGAAVVVQPGIVVATSSASTAPTPTSVDAVPASAEEATAAVTPAMVLTVIEGEPLEVAIVRFAHEQGFTTEWKVAGGFEAKRSLTYKGASVREVLGNILPALGVSADIYKQESHIVVRPADAALDF